MTRTHSRPASAAATGLAALLILAACGSNANDDDPAANPAGCGDGLLNNADAVVIPIPAATITDRVTGDPSAPPTSSTPSSSTTPGPSGTNPSGTSPAAGSTSAAASNAAAPGEIRSVLFSNTLEVSQVAGQSPTGGNDDLTMTVASLPDCANPAAFQLRFTEGSSTLVGVNSDLDRTLATRGGVSVDAAGNVTTLRLIAPESVGVQAQSALEQALIQTLSRAIALPPGPLRVGDAWTATRELSTGATVTQVTRARVSAVGADGAVTVDAEISEEPINSVFTVPGGSQTLAIESYTFAGNAVETRLAGQPLPIDGEIILDGGRTLTGDSNTLTQKTGYTARWSR